MNWILFTLLLNGCLLDILLVAILKIIFSIILKVPLHPKYILGCLWAMEDGSMMWIFSLSQKPNLPAEPLHFGQKKPKQNTWKRTKNLECYNFLTRLFLVSQRTNGTNRSKPPRGKYTEKQECRTTVWLIKGTITTDAFFWRDYYRCR